MVFYYIFTTVPAYRRVNPFLWEGVSQIKACSNPKAYAEGFARTARQLGGRGVVLEFELYDMPFAVGAIARQGGNAQELAEWARDNFTLYLKHHVEGGVPGEQTPVLNGRPGEPASDPNTILAPVAHRYNRDLKGW